MNRLEAVRSEAERYGQAWPLVDITDVKLLLAVAEAAAEWLAAIERFRDPFVPISDTRALATAAENKMRAAIAPLMEEVNSV